MAFGPGVADANPPLANPREPSTACRSSCPHGTLVHVGRRRSVRIVAPLDRVDVAIVQFGLQPR